MIDSIRQFQDAIQATGLEPPEVIEPGKWHRFPGLGKRQRNTAGWCKLFNDGEGGVFGDFSTGLSQGWQAKRGNPFTLSEREAFKRHVAEARAQAEAERDVRENDAANRATNIWDALSPAPNYHPYLVSKGIEVHGAKLNRSVLVLPVMDFTGKLTSLQFIKPNGDKKLLTGGRKRGCFIPVAGDTAEPSRVIICEGWATGCTLAEADTSALVLAAIDKDNLKLVAVEARRCWPSAESVIAGDDDRSTAGNPGATKARAAAIAAGAKLALPRWPADAPMSLSDFNDLSQWFKGRTS